MAKTEPNPASQKSKAEGDRWQSDADTVERRDREMGTQDERDESPGITNRTIDEERENQESLPPRGSSREGAHAGRGRDESDEDR